MGAVIDINHYKKFRGEVVRVTIDEKLIHAFVEEIGEVIIFHASMVTNMVPIIDQIEDGQKVELTLNHSKEVLNAKIVYTEEAA